MRRFSLCVALALLPPAAAELVACVTGATGYLGAEVVGQLLDAGWIVRGTVRDPNDEDKTRALRALPFANDRLALVAADLLGGPGDFADCVDGADALFHTASPFITTNIVDAQSQLVKPAVEGTENAVKAALASSSVRRIVITSSIAAVMGKFTDKEGCFDEDDWNESSRGLSVASSSSSRCGGARRARGGCFTLRTPLSPQQRGDFVFVFVFVFGFRFHFRFVFVLVLVLVLVLVVGFPSLVGLLPHAPHPLLSRRHPGQFTACAWFVSSRATPVRSRDGVARVALRG